MSRRRTQCFCAVMHPCCVILLGLSKEGNALTCHKEELEDSILRKKGAGGKWGETKESALAVSGGEAR